MAALDDMLAVASNGAYPSPTPTDAQRAMFAISYGLLDAAPAAVEAAGGLGRLGTDLTMT